MLKALLVDDDRIVLESMKALLAEDNDVEVCGVAADAEEALLKIDQLQPDVLFLDVHMPGMDGFEMVQKLPYRIDIIFVTTSESHAIRAFEWNALDYLLKPVNPARLRKSVERVLARKLSTDEPEYTYSGAPGKYQDYIYLPMACSQIFIRADDILCIQSHRNNSRVVLSDGRIFEIRRSLNDWERRLDGVHFYRINREVVIHVHKIKEVVKHHSEVYCLDENAVRYPVSRRRVCGLKELLSRQPDL